ncbi:MAG: ABC-type transport auxiliary lipoprotein family protein [Pseudomonadota bacterium]|nr:ABC-type transport auxiliary lipoprotein family protein [Pseudomonadota bacterium]
MRLPAALPVAVLVLSGCTVFPIPEAPRLMDLDEPAPSMQLDDSRAVSLRVDTPLASDPIDSARILIKPSAYEFQAVGGAQWRDSIPVILRDYLVQQFRASGGFDNVASDTSPATTDHTLVLEISGFHARLEGPQTEVQLRVHSELLNNQSRTTLCTRNFSVNEPIEGTALETLMAGFSAGAERLSSELTSWAHTCLAQPY